jgi:glucan phosphoethanolaminetransferase (alkaline phosphatase superfamily)
MKVEQLPLTTKVTSIFLVFFSIPVLQIGLLNLSLWTYKGLMILTYHVFLWFGAIALLQSKRWAWHVIVCGNAIGLIVISVFCPVEAILFGIPISVLALVDFLLWMKERKT